MLLKKIYILSCLLLTGFLLFAQQDIKIKKKDRKKDIEMVTSKGTMIFRLSDSTPLHRDNFIRLVKSGYYNDVLFHRVIKNFMIQGGDPDSRGAEAGIPLGNGGPGYTIPAEFNPLLFHKKGALAAARMGDDTNPLKASSGSQFYIVQGKVFSDGALDTLENTRLKGRKLPVEHREVYKTLGGTPHLDQSYTVYGELISGMDVLDSIAVTETSKAADRDRPVTDIKIIETKLVKRKKK